jgi:protein-tyrosine phosphatase
LNPLGRFRRLQDDFLDTLIGPPPRASTSRPELRVLFVCYGNSCRSPLAEGIFRSKLASAGLLGRVAVDSAGTNAGDVGGAPDWRARRVARNHGIMIGDLRSRRFEREDFDKFDWILVLDRHNRDDVLAVAQSDADRDKVRLLSHVDREVADPVHGDHEDFEHTYRQIDEACEALLADIRVALVESCES